MADSAAPSSSTPSFSKPLQLPVSEETLAQVNTHLRTLSPSEILQWSIEHLPNLYQTTAFGLTGLAGLDMLSKLTSNPPPLIFVDTLYHFKETLQLVEEVERKYGKKVIVYKPEDCETTEDFEKKHGQKLWERDEESYDYHVKVIYAYVPVPFRIPILTIILSIR
jgi:phosphoadenosine phosphosulfate reductase